MKFKQRLGRSRSLNEANLESRLLKAISNMPSFETKDYVIVSGIFNFIDSMYVQVYEDIDECLSELECSAYEAFRAGAQSGDLAPKGEDEPVFVDRYSGIIYALGNKGFSGKVIARCLKKDPGFNIYDEDEALKFIENYE